MSWVRDITDLMRKGPEIATQLNDIRINTKSIASGAKDATFQFPCLIVDTAPLDMANTIARTLDQVYASFAQTWLSMNSMFDITIDPTPLSYLKKLHQNVQLEFVEDHEEVNNYMEKVYSGEYVCYMTPDKTFGVVFNKADHPTKNMMESHKEQLNEYLYEFNLRPFLATEAPGDEVPARNPNPYDFAQAVLAGSAEKNAFDKRDKIMKQTQASRAPRITDRELKRANDLVPYGIEVRLIAVNDKKEFIQFIDFIVGIKTVLHLVNSDDMIENIARALQNKSLFFKFLRWTSGEISLFKDLILNLADIKADALNKANGRSPFFSTLKRLKGRKISTTNLTVPHFLIPNSTIVVTSYEVEFLKNNYGIDLTDAKIGKKLMSILFLMALVIMDEGTETISILYDGDSVYQTYALETLERDNALNSNKLSKEIGRMISR